MNFHVTPDPEKSDGKMFGKSVKTLIFCHFGPILGKEKKKIFFFFVEKSSSISLLILQLSVNMQKIRKKQEAVTK